MERAPDGARFSSSEHCNVRTNAMNNPLTKMPALVCIIFLWAPAMSQAQKKPNILVI
jgi:hypothetical protein